MTWAFFSRCDFSKSAFMKGLTAQNLIFLWIASKRMSLMIAVCRLATLIKAISSSLGVMSSSLMIA